MSSNSPSARDLKCDHIKPDPGAPLHQVISRWSDTWVQRPAIVATPKSEDEIISAVLYARDNGLRLVPANGGHGSFVPIDSNTLYLDMSKFDRVVLDEASGTAHVGGGASTGEVIAALTPHGWYTLWPNSDAVGYVGCVLGGGISTLYGVHGLMIDAVESFRLVTSDGRSLEVSQASKGDELDLFHALCGAGHGLSVVTSVTMKMWPIAGLSMLEDKIWTRALLFPPNAVDVAAAAFVRQKPEASKLNTTLLFMRAPPSSPMPGAPIIRLAASYRGPADEAERLTGALFEKDTVSRAVKDDTVGVPFATANAVYSAHNVHGGHKEPCTCLLRTTSQEAIVSAFNLWLQLGEQHPDANASIVVINRFLEDASMSNGLTPTGRSGYFDSRDRGIVMYSMVWYTRPETTAAKDQFVADLLGAFWAHDDVEPRTPVNNMRPGMNLEELHSKERIAKLKVIQKMWDPKGVFWSPFGAGWPSAQTQ